MTMKKLETTYLGEWTSANAEIVSIRSYFNNNGNEKIDELHIYDSEDGKIELDEDEAKHLLECLKKVFE